MTYDYLLYDNRTLGPSGYDWGVKIATGRLEDDQAAKQKFVKYCEHSFDTRLGPLSNFDAALGGIRLDGRGYLLCITLETRDLHHRPSFAFVGIHCPQTLALKDLLMQGDPILSARQTSENPGPKLVLQANPLVSEGPLTGGDRPAGRYLFQPGSSPRNAAEILVRQIQKGARLPSILGIAQWSANRNQLLSSYEFAYCVGLPPGAEPPQKAAIDRTKTKGSFPGTRAWVYLGAMLCAAVAAFVYYKPLGSTPISCLDPIISPTPAPQPSYSATPTPEPGPSTSPQPSEQVVGPDAFLQRFKKVWDRFELASPQSLSATPELTTLKEIPVLSEHESERRRMIALLSTDLPHFKDDVEKADFLHYFEPEMVKKMSSSERADTIRRIASAIPAPVESCRLLRSSFALWTEHSKAGEWCTLVDDFVKESR